MKPERVSHCPGGRREPDGVWIACPDRAGCVRWYLRQREGEAAIEPRFELAGRTCPDWVPLVEY